MALGVYEGDNAKDGPSPALWYDCPWAFAKEDPSIGYGYEDDFIEFPTHTAGTGASLGAYTSFYTSGGTFIKLATEDDGVVQATSVATNGDEAYLTDGYNLAGLGRLGTLVSGVIAAKDFWQEGRVRLADIDDVGMFFGVSQEGQAAAGTIQSGGLLPEAAAAFVGLFVPATNLAAPVSAVYQKASTTMQVVAAAVASMVAGAFMKLGQKYTSVDRTHRFFANGIEVAKFVFSNAGVPQIAGVAGQAYPNGVRMGQLWANRTADAGAVAKNPEIDWWKIFFRR